MPVARRMTQGALDAAVAARTVTPEAEHDYNAPENQLENYRRDQAADSLEA